MIDAPCSGCAHQAAPTQLILEPARSGRTLKLYAGRSVSVCCGRYEPDQWGEQVHRHELISCLLDEAEIQVRIEIARGIWKPAAIHGPAIWVIPHRMRYELVCLGCSDVVTLFCEPAFVRMTLGPRRTKFLTTPLAQLTSQDGLAARLVAAFRLICRGEADDHELYVEAAGTILATHVLRRMFPFNRPPHAVDFPSEKADRLLRYIGEHITEKLDLHTLARVCSMSCGHFSRVFKGTFKVTPHRFVMQQRVAKAEKLLQTTTEKEIAIALQCGFSDDTLMARWFRRIAGCLPSDVRARRRRDVPPNGWLE